LINKTNFQKHFFFKDSATPAPQVEVCSSDDEEEPEDLEWDNSWCNQLEPIPEETEPSQKEWESTGEGAACLTFLQGQVLFNAQKLKRLSQQQNDQQKKPEMVSVEIHGVPLEDPEELPPPPPPTICEDQEQKEDEPLPPPPSDAELHGSSPHEIYQMTYL